MTKIVNSLVKALNDAVLLPRIILVIPDDDLLHEIGKLRVGTEAMIIIEKVVSWVMTEMEHAIQSKKEELRKKKPGSITTGEPKVIWIKMIKRYNACNNLMQVRNTYNEIVEKCLLNKTGHYIMDVIDKMTDQSYFLPQTPYSLTNDGKARYWREVDFQLENFDDQKLSLKPQRQLEVAEVPQGGRNINPIPHFKYNKFYKHGWKKNNFKQKRYFQDCRN